jgi:spermidine synthase
VTVNRRDWPLWGLTLIFAFCSVVYELILAQTLSILLGHTLLRYAVTIGLYIFSLGLGSLFVWWLPAVDPVRRLLWVEIFLSPLGVLLPFVLFAVDHVWREWLGSSLVVWALHSFVVVIGILSGIELPCLMQWAEVRNAEDSEAAQKVLAVDYIATFLGTVAFPVWIYSHWGLVAGAAAVGGLNALGCIFLLLVARRSAAGFALGFAGVLFLSVLMFAQEANVREWLIAWAF